MKRSFVGSKLANPFGPGYEDLSDRAIKRSLVRNSPYAGVKDILQPRYSSRSLKAIIQKFHNSVGSIKMFM